MRNVPSRYCRICTSNIRIIVAVKERPGLRVHNDNVLEEYEKDLGRMYVQAMLRIEVVPKVDSDPISTL
jgi:ubiquinone biosynthesis protein Coq4